MINIVFLGMHGFTNHNCLFCIFIQVELSHTLDDPDAMLSDIHWLPAHRALFLVVNATTLALFHPDNKTVEEVSILRIYSVKKEQTLQIFYTSKENFFILSKTFIFAVVCAIIAL